MVEDRTVEQKRSSQSKYVFKMLDVMGKRPFNRQIRSEECGCCTCTFAEEILSNMLKSVPHTFELLEQYLEKIQLFHQLPRFTIKILFSSLKYLDDEIHYRAEQKDKAISSSHELVSKAIKKLVNKAIEYYSEPNPNWLWFCRVAEPILIISEAYETLCEKGEVKVPQKQRVSDYIKTVEDLKEKLISLEGKPNFPEYNKDEEIAKRRAYKRVWSGGVCKLLFPDDLVPLPKDKEKDKELDPLYKLEVYCERIKPIIELRKSQNPLMKIWNFSQKAMLVFSGHDLNEGETYNFDVYFNSIDLPFSAKAILWKEIKEFDVHSRHREDFMNKYEVKHCYIFNFDNFPEPKYYFLSLCRDLYEQQREWDADAFGSMFCGAYWNKKSP